MLRRAGIHMVVWLCLPWVTWWAWCLERRILRTGRALSSAELDNAAKVGVALPRRIRVLAVPQVPMPGPAWAQRLAARFGFDGSTTSGMALRYGVFVREDCAHRPGLIAHECVHTAQYERLGSLAAFLRRYLVECLALGYHASPLEQEARERSAGIT
jgi:hypothetical protein